MPGAESAVAEAPWYACYTRSRHEKRVEERLREKGFAVFLPLIPRERQWHDRTKIVEFPLFPSYVFARFEDEALYQVMETPGVATVVQFNGEPVPITEQEMVNVRRFAEAMASGDFEPEATPMVSEGERVEIVAGPLEGVEGRVVQHRGEERVLVAVGLDAIGQGLKVEVDLECVERLGGERNSRHENHG